MEYNDVIGFGRSQDKFKQPTGGVGADNEYSLVGVDQSDGIGECVPDRLVADAMAPS